MKTTRSSGTRSKGVGVGNSSAIRAKITNARVPTKRADGLGGGGGTVSPRK